MEFFSFVRDHMAHALPILLVGALSLAIVVERGFALFVRYPLRNVDAFFERISNLVMSAKIAEATKLCDENQSKLPCRVIKTALSRAHLPEGVIHDGLNLSIQQCTSLVSKRTSFLAMTANVATLLGLFGTVAGLIQSFQAVASADAQQKSALLAAGISTAMNATMMGLAVAIPCMVAYSFLMNRSNQITSDCEQAAVRILDILKQRYYANEAPPAPGQNSEAKLARAA